MLFGDKKLKPRLILGFFYLTFLKKYDIIKEKMEKKNE
jgi:hypothetical protein